MEKSGGKGQWFYNIKFSSVSFDIISHMCLYGIFFLENDFRVNILLKKKFIITCDAGEFYILNCYINDKAYMTKHCNS